MIYTAKVLAIRRLDFITDKNEEVKGHQVWLSVPSESKSWNGNEITKTFVKDDSPHAGDAAALLADDVVLVEFNRYGKPVITDFAPVLV